MRLRNRRERDSPPEPTQSAVAVDNEVDSTLPVTWSVEQLNALGPMTGPSHRSFVPIVRSQVQDISLGGQLDSVFHNQSLESSSRESKN